MITARAPKLTGLRNALAAERRRVIAGAEQAMREGVLAGAVALDDTLEHAYTDTGLHRELIRGGSAGRHDTGNMVSKIRTNADAPEIGGDQIAYSFGWFAGDFEAYFAQQDLGTDGDGRHRGIPAAHGMSVGASVARQTAKAALRRNL